MPFQAYLRADPAIISGRPENRPLVSRTSASSRSVPGWVTAVYSGRDREALKHQPGADPPGSGSQETLAWRLSAAFASYRGRSGQVLRPLRFGGSADGRAHVRKPGWAPAPPRSGGLVALQG
jgi:hypothetical protein